MNACFSHLFKSKQKELSGFKWRLDMYLTVYPYTCTLYFWGVVYTYNTSTYITSTYICIYTNFLLLSYVFGFGKLLIIKLVYYSSR